MKQHMARKKEELDAQNAQFRQQNRPGQRPGPNPAAAPPAPRPIEKVANLTDFAAVWAAARNYLAHNARMLESVLGSCSQVVSLDVATSDVTVSVPSAQRNFTNDKARAKLEEAIRAVTERPLKLTVTFIDRPESGPGAPVPGSSGPGNSPLAAAQRVPPEIMSAVEKQPVIRELIKRFDATVTQVEILDSALPEAAPEA